MLECENDILNFAHTKNYILLVVKKSALLIFVFCMLHYNSMGIGKYIST